jgi:hypothetical protein
VTQTDSGAIAASRSAPVRYGNPARAPTAASGSSSCATCRRRSSPPSCAARNRLRLSQIGSDPPATSSEPQSGREDRAPLLPDQRKPAPAAENGCGPASARIRDQRQVAGEPMNHRHRRRVSVVRAEFGVTAVTDRFGQISPHREYFEPWAITRRTRRAAVGEASRSAAVALATVKRPLDNRPHCRSAHHDVPTARGR